MNIKRCGSLADCPVDLLLLADPSEERVTRSLQEGVCFIAEEGGQTVGAYILLRTKEKTMEIANVAVYESMQGKGIGKKLIFHAIEEAKRYGCESLEVGTGNSSIGQLAFYQKCGFRIIGIELDFFSRNYPELIWENGILCRDMVRLTLGLT